MDGLSILGKELLVSQGMEGFVFRVRSRLCMALEFLPTAISALCSITSTHMQDNIPSTSRCVDTETCRLVQMRYREMQSLSAGPMHLVMKTGLVNIEGDVSSYHTR